MLTQILVVFCHIKLQSISSLIPSTLTDDSHLYVIEMGLSHILMIVLFLSNIRLVIFAKIENNFDKFMTPKWFRITTNPIIRGSSFFFNIKPPARYTHTYIHTYIHAYIHTYIHTYIQHLDCIDNNPQSLSQVIPLLTPL